MLSSGELTLQDQQRRELVANISHDLRTPLTSLHGYLETLRLKAGILDDEERRRYLDIALGQSRKVGRLAQELFELARLEYGVVKPEKENFALADLVQDVFQKFELAAGRVSNNSPDIAPGLPIVGRLGHDRARVNKPARQRHPPYASRRRDRGAVASNEYWGRGPG